MQNPGQQQQPMLLPGQQIQLQLQQQQMLAQQQQQQQQQQAVHMPAGAQPLPGMAALPALPQQAGHGGNVQEMVPGDTGTVIYKGGPSNGRGPLPNPGDNSSNEDEAFPPPPPVRGGPNSADNSLNDSNSTTQSNVTSECSEAECDREPLVKPQSRASFHDDPNKELTAEEMQKLIERNQIVNPTTAAQAGGANMQI